MGIAGNGMAPVLVVDDDAAIRELLRVLLDVEGIPVALAANGREALTKLESGLRPRIVLLDYMMPEMNGGEFLKHFRMHPEWQDIPVFMFTAFGEAKIPEGVPILSKPIDYDALLSVVRPAEGR